MRPLGLRALNRQDVVGPAHREALEVEEQCVALGVVADARGEVEVEQPAPQAGRARGPAGKFMLHYSNKSLSNKPLLACLSRFHGCRQCCYAALALARPSDTIHRDNGPAEEARRASGTTGPRQQRGRVRLEAPGSAADRPFDRDVLGREGFFGELGEQPAHRLKCGTTVLCGGDGVRSG